MDQHALQIVIEAPGRDYQTYAYDPQTQTLHLTGIVYTGWRLPGDLALVPDTLTANSRPLDVLLVGNLANAPGVRVDARPIGLLLVSAGGTTDAVVVAVPNADATFAHISDASDLAPVRRAEIEQFFATHELVGGASRREVQWCGIRDADRVIRAARRTARLAKNKQPKSARAPAWKPIARITNGGQHAAHTPAELSLFSLPYRFQEYVGDLLLPAERILRFVSRPPLRAGRLMGGTQEHEGLLVVTDQQVLWMVDVLPPQPGIVGYGYAATVGVLERLDAARVHDDDLPLLELSFRAPAGGSETFSIRFHPTQAAALSEVVSFLARFLPQANTRRLRRVFVPDPDEPLGAPYENAGDLPDASGAVERLRNRRAPLLEPGEQIRAEGLAIDLGNRRYPAALLSVTNRRALLVHDGAIPESIDFARVTSLQLGYSVMGPWLSVKQAAGQRPQVIRMDIPLIAFSPFNRCFLAMRQALVAQPDARHT